MNARDATRPRQNTATAGSRERKDADTIADLGLLVPNIELATGCNPAHMPGNPPSTLAQSLTQRLLTLLRITDLIPLSALEIYTPESLKPVTESDADEEDATEQEAEAEVKAFWTLYIDILIISLDGSAFDAAWGATLASLRSTLLPAAWWDPNPDSVVCDPRVEKATKLDIRGFPIALSFGVFKPTNEGNNETTRKKGMYVLADPDDFEESCCEGSVTVVVDDGGKRVWRVELGGTTLVQPSMLRELVQRTGERWTEWKGVLEA